jgi:hypothetical protein
VPLQKVLSQLMLVMALLSLLVPRLLVLLSLLLSVLTRLSQGYRLPVSEHSLFAG